MIRFLLIMVILAAGFEAAASAEEETATLMVLNLTPQAQIDPELVKMLTEITTAEIAAMKRFRVVGQGDIDKMLNIEQQKQLAGCAETSCLAEIAGAMGTQWVVDGSVGAYGTQSMLSLRLVNVKKAEVAARQMQMVTGDREQLIGIVKDVVRKLFEQAEGASVEKPAAVEKPPVVAAAAVEQPAQQVAAAAKMEGRTWTWVAAGAAAAGLAAGIAGALGVSGARSDADELKKKTVASDELDKLEARGKKWALVANAGFSLAAAGGGAAIALFFIEGKSDEQETLSVAPMPAGGLAVVIEGNF